MKLVHVFEETDEFDQQDHINRWFGFVREDELDEEFLTVCRCGGKLVPLDYDVDTSS